MKRWTVVAWRRAVFSPQLGPCERSVDRQIDGLRRFSGAFNAARSSLTIV